MAKEKKTDISFDKLTNLNLDAKPNVDEVIEEKNEKRKVGRPPSNKGEIMRTSYKYEKDIHLALKRYCLDHEIDMGAFVFEQIIKEVLTEKGYYPPKKRG